MIPRFVSQFQRARGVGALRWKNVKGKANATDLPAKRENHVRPDAGATCKPEPRATGRGGIQCPGWRADSALALDLCQQTDAPQQARHAQLCHAPRDLAARFASRMIRRFVP